MVLRKFERFEEQIDDKSEKPSQNVEIRKLENLTNIENYFENLSDNPYIGLILENTAKLNREGTFLYEVSEKEETEKETKRQFHIFWIYNSPEETTLPLSKESWKELKENPEFLEKINQILIKNYLQALKFYPWKKSPPRGFIIIESPHFGFEAGDCRGIKISYQEIEPLFGAIKREDKEKIQKISKHLAASFVHELVHNEREEGILSQPETEIASHIAQFLFDPQQNEILNQQFEESLSHIESAQNKSEDKKVELYDKSQYFAQVLIAKKLAEQNLEYKKILEEDQSPGKIKALRQLKNFIKEEDYRYLKEKFLPEVMETPGSQLLKEAVDTAQSWGIDLAV